MTMIRSNQLPLRIAVFTYSYFPAMTGISSLVHERISYLLRENHTVRLFHPRVPQGEESVANGAAGLNELRQLGQFSSVAFPSVPNPFRRSFPEAASWRVWDDSALLEEFSPDVILVDEATGLFGAASAWIRGYGRPVGVRYAQKYNVPCINLLQTDWVGYGEQHVGTLIFKLCQPLLRLMMKPVVEGYDASLSPSNYLATRNRSIYGHRVGHLGFHGVDCQRFTPDNLQFHPESDRETPVILSTGRLTREKNVWQLLEAFRHVHRELPEAQLVILGRGPLLGKLRAASRSFGDRVLLPGALFGDELKGWYARANIYWTASVTENFSAAILESLASGTPVVAAAAGGNVEQVVEGSCGHLVGVNDSRQMAARSLELLRNPERLRVMSLAARERALKLSLEVSTDRLIEFANRLIRQKRSADLIPGDVLLSELSVAG
ncbi:MAG: glycosyltransferase [Planctomyces sp.]|nr:glycosyltransferase [Planctomyces sp.]